MKNQNNGNDDIEQKEVKGALKFAVSLPPDIAKLFLRECEEEVRDMASQARFILQRHYKEKQMQEEMQLRQLRRGGLGQIPTFPDEDAGLTQGEGPV